MNEIKDKINSLFDEFESSELYQRYVSVKRQLEQSEDVMNTIKEIKRLQKIATNNQDNDVENKIKKLYKILDETPIYQSYMIIKDEVNETLYGVKEIFEKYFSELLSLES
ncbi:MAG: YlbF family regulator [Bacilli bacterium]|nr:YlbF family regulator [Bacilli bacterium]